MAKNFRGGKECVFPYKSAPAFSLFAVTYAPMSANRAILYTKGVYGRGRGYGKYGPNRSTRGYEKPAACYPDAGGGRERRAFSPQSYG